MPSILQQLLEVMYVKIINYRRQFILDQLFCSGFAIYSAILSYSLWKIFFEIHAFKVSAIPYHLALWLAKIQIKAFLNVHVKFDKDFLNSSITIVVQPIIWARSIMSYSSISLYQPQFLYLGTPLLAIF